MTAQEAAHLLLVEAKKPQSSRILAERMLKRGLVRSNASDPIQSFEQTIEKNIRDKAYNRPALKFVHTPQGRLVDVASAHDVPTNATTDGPFSAVTAPRVKIIGPEERTFVELSARLVNKIGLVVFAGIAGNLDEAADLVVLRGLDAMKDEIATGMRAALSSPSTVV